MARKSMRWKMYGGEVGVVVLVDESPLAMGWVENGCADGSTGCSSSRMDLGDAAVLTWWRGLMAAQRAVKGIRKNSRVSGDAGTMLEGVACHGVRYPEQQQGTTSPATFKS